MTLRLVEPIRAELRRHNLLDLYNSIELPLTPVLLQMELYGVALDAGFLSELEKKLSEQIHKLETEIYASVGHQFNINSTKQLGDILFGELKLPSGKKTKTGYSVSADVIEGLRGKHPMVDSLLEYRQLTKLKSTYVDGLLALMDPVTGRQRWDGRSGGPSLLIQAMCCSPPTTHSSSYASWRTLRMSRAWLKHSAKVRIFIQ
ncbi:MAG: hypothetical protein E6J44_08220, partial [Chloroflexi bacterium]